MSDEQRRVALFLAQPEGLGLFLSSAVANMKHQQTLRAHD
jgi:hypothetical protein